MIWGDIVHSAFLQCAMPAWHYSADVDQDAAAATRLAMFRRAIADRLPVAGMHLPFPGFGTIVPEGDAVCVRAGGVASADLRRRAGMLQPPGLETMSCSSPISVCGIVICGLWLASSSK